MPLVEKCPKCGAESGDDWSRCDGVCPIQSSPHHRPWDGIVHAEVTSEEESMTKTERELLLLLAEARAQEIIRGPSPSTNAELPKLSRLMGYVEGEQKVREADNARKK